MNEGRGRSGSGEQLRDLEKRLWGVYQEGSNLNVNEKIILGIHHFQIPYRPPSYSWFIKSMNIPSFKKKVMMTDSELFWTSHDVFEVIK